jgi:electron transfer flavoprotein alpha subunit
MAKGIWIFIEQAKGDIRKVSLEVVSEAKKIADAKGEELTAIIVGKDVVGLADKAAAYGATKAIVIEDDKLENYTTGAYTSVITAAAKKYEPAAILLGNSAVGKDLAPRLAQRLGTGQASDVVGIEADDENYLKFKRPIYAGKAFTDVVVTGIPVIATVRPNTFPLADADASAKAEVTTESAEIDAADLKAIVKDVVLAASVRPELVEADIIVSGGRGMGGAEKFVLLDELADVVGAAVGGSRAAVEAGYIEQMYQVGQTGKVVSPTLYIAVGISGAIQHLAGMGTSKVIVAINKDPDANIFTLADYGIVGDLNEIVPLLTEEFKKLQA